MRMRKIGLARETKYSHSSHLLEYVVDLHCHHKQQPPSNGLLILNLFLVWGIMTFGLEP